VIRILHVVTDPGLGGAQAMLARLVAALDETRFRTARPLPTDTECRF